MDALRKFGVLETKVQSLTFNDASVLLHDLITKANAKHPRSNASPIRPNTPGRLNDEGALQITPSDASAGDDE